MTDRRARVTQAPRDDCEADGEVGDLAEFSLFINFVIHSRRFLPHVVTGPDGPAARQGTLGPECETPADKHNDDKARRV